MALSKSTSKSGSAKKATPTVRRRKSAATPKPEINSVEEQPVVVKTYKKSFYIAAGIAVVGIIILLIVIFSKPKPKPVTSSDIVGYQKANEALGEVLQIRAVQRAYDSVELIKKSDTIKFYKNETERYKTLAGKNATFYKDNATYYRNIPNLVPRITNKDSLRAEAKILK